MSIKIQNLTFKTNQYRKAYSFLPILIFLLFFVCPSTGHSESPPPEGDWIISDVTTIQGQTIILNGNLIVQPGGSLTLNNVTLTLNCTFDGQYGIVINQDGSMFINNSILTSEDELHAYNFVVNGSSFEMKNSELHNCGWGPASENLGEDDILSGNRGLVIRTNQAVLEGNNISKNHVGIILAGSGIALERNHIHSNSVHGINVYKGSNCNIASNHIQHGSVSSPIRIIDAINNSITDNIIESSIHRGVIETLWSYGNKINNNHISGLGVGILMMFVSNDNTIKNNNISTDECGIVAWGWNNAVEGNSISNPEESIFTGIFLLYAYNSVVSDNTINDVSGENGIWMRHSSSNKISGNTINALPDSENSHSSGILLTNKCMNNVVGKNRISSFSRGIGIFYSSDGNTIAGNELSASKLQNILIEASSGNTVYQNNFLDNDRPPYDSGINQWFLNGQGNYWSDYDGLDSDGDGVGDEPYSIEPSGTDDFPLINSVAIDTVEIKNPDPTIKPDKDQIFSKIISGNDVIENQKLNLGFISISEGAKLTIRNTELITGGTDRFSDIQVNNGGELIVENCKIVHLDNGYGFQFRAWQGSNLLIKDSELNGCGHEWWYGGLLIFSDSVVLENNIIINTPIKINNCSSGRIAGNMILDNYYSISIGSSNSIDLTNNVISGSVREAITIAGSNDITLTNNTISKIWREGVHIFNSSNILLEANSFAGTGNDFNAINLGSEGAKALNNTVSDFSTGLRLDSTNQTATGNSITNCTTGIEVRWDNSQINGNLISDCSQGLSLYGSNHNLYENTISDCSNGIHCLIGHDCMIIHNNFIGNDSQASEINCKNYWDNGSDIGGNYWSDHDCMGNPSNGDQPYYINSNSIDRYPFSDADGWQNGNADNSDSGNGGGGMCFLNSLLI